MAEVILVNFERRDALKLRQAFARAGFYSKAANTKGLDEESLRDHNPLFVVMAISPDDEECRKLSLIVIRALPRPALLLYRFDCDESEVDSTTERVGIARPPGRTFIFSREASGEEIVRFVQAHCRKGGLRAIRQAAARVRRRIDHDTISPAGILVYAIQGLTASIAKSRYESGGRLASNDIVKIMIARRHLDDFKRMERHLQGTQLKMLRKIAEALEARLGFACSSPLAPALYAGSQDSAARALLIRKIRPLREIHRKLRKQLEKERNEHADATAKAYLDAWLCAASLKAIKNQTSTADPIGIAVMEVVRESRAYARLANISPEEQAAIHAFARQEMSRAEGKGDLVPDHITPQRSSEDSYGDSRDDPSPWREISGKPYFSIRYLASHVGRTPQSVYRWISSGKIRVKTIDGRLCVPAQEFVRALSLLQKRRGGRRDVGSKDYTLANIIGRTRKDNRIVYERGRKRILREAQRLGMKIRRNRFGERTFSIAQVRVLHQVVAREGEGEEADR